MQLLKKLGPGLLYAAAAIGVSHLVQSTRAGANFGNQLIWAVVVANVLKYPLFRVGPLYTSLTQKTLLEGYQNLGGWVIGLFYLMTLATMFTVQAAVTLVTAGLAINLSGIDISAQWMACALLVISGSILVIGKYNILDNFIKIIVIVLTLTTLSSVFICSLGDFPKPLDPVLFDWNDKTHIFFLVALIGWMPAPMDVPIWHSLWTKAKQQTHKVSTTESLQDFNIGYIGTAILAVCFLLLGSFVMYRSGVVFSDKAGVFAAQLIEMYTQALGEWSYPLIAIAAFTTMFSTTLTCLDAFPRILAEADRISFKNLSRSTYKIWMGLTIIGASVIIFQFLSGMKALVDLATTLSFVVGPIYAYLNLKILYGMEIPKKYTNAPWLKALSFLSFIFLAGFAIYFLLVKFIW